MAWQWSIHHIFSITHYPLIKILCDKSLCFLSDPGLHIFFLIVRMMWIILFLFLCWLLKSWKSNWKLKYINYFDTSGCHFGVTSSFWHFCFRFCLSISIWHLNRLFHWLFFCWMMLKMVTMKTNMTISITASMANRPDLWSAFIWVELGFSCISMSPNKPDCLVSEWIELVSRRYGGVHEERNPLHAEGIGLCKWSQRAQVGEEHSPSWSLPESAGDLLRRMGPGLLAELFWGVGEAFGPAVADGFPFMTRHSGRKGHREFRKDRGETNISILPISRNWNNHHRPKYPVAQDYKVVLIVCGNNGSEEGGMGETFKSHLGYARCLNPWIMETREGVEKQVGWVMK